MYKIYKYIERTYIVYIYILIIYEVTWGLTIEARSEISSLCDHRRAHVHGPRRHSPRTPRPHGAPVAPALPVHATRHCTKQ